MESKEGGGLKDEGNAVGVYELDAAVAVLQRCCRAGLAALPKAEKSTKTRFYSTIERTRKIQSRYRERAKELAKEGRDQGKSARRGDASRRRRKAKPAGRLSKSG